MAIRHKWVTINGVLTEVDPDYRAPRIPGPYIQGDLPGYLSPVTGQLVDGRRDRREDLARSGCREVDPSESPGGRYDMGRMADRDNFNPIIPEVKDV